jgi:hypothetical protein
MKLETAKPVFTPVALIIETPEELALMRALFGACSGRVYKAFGLPDNRIYSALDRADITSPRVSLEAHQIATGK